MFAGRLDDLTIVSSAELSATRTWSDLGILLSRLKAALDMSLAEIQGRAGRLGLARDLPRATVSEVMNGRRRPSAEVLSCLLKVFEVPPELCADWHQTWQRLAAAPPADRLPRFDEVAPRQLGIHAAITAEDCLSELPQYVTRDFDDDLRKHISERIEQGCFVLLVGSSSSGKTRSLYEAVNVVAPNWPVVRPADSGEIVEILDDGRRRIIVWLDEMERFLDADPQLTREHVIRLLQFPALIVATLWPDDFLKRKTPRGSGTPGRIENDRRLFDIAKVVTVPDAFSGPELEEAGRVAQTDSRIRLALQVEDAGLTQALAAGPDLLHRWQLANPYARAVISFAADARRLGVRSPIPGLRS